MSILLLVGVALAAEPSLMDLAFLAGHWRSDDGAAEEVWTTPTPTVMVGAGRVTLASRKVSTEALRIEADAGGIRYVASPTGQATTAFALTSLEGAKVVFENPAHDFPQRITYWVPAPGRLSARVEARDGEGWKGFELHWRRVD